MRKVLLVEIAYPCTPRLQKIGKLIEDADFYYCLWNRDGQEIEKNSKYYVLDKLSKYGNVFALFISLISFYKHFKKTYKEINPDIIICRFWITAFLASFFVSKEKTFIYDVNDLPYGNLLIRSISSLFEKVPLCKANIIILSSRFYEEFYSRYKEKTVVFENLTLNKTKNKKAIKSCNEKTICFYGCIRYKKILLNMINAFKNTDYKIIIAGFGRDKKEIEEYVSINKINNVHIHGKFKYSDLEKMYEESTFVWTAYPSKDRNCIYSISNKFFEAIEYGKIPIVSKGTKIGEVVSEKNIGIVVNCYDSNDIYTKIINANVEGIKKNIKNNKKYIVYDVNLTLV